MTDDALLTLREMADKLELPESTVRYYRDAFLDHIPSVGTGRRRRYPVQAVAVLRSIAKAYASGMSRAEVQRSLEGGRPRPAAEYVPSDEPKDEPRPGMDEDVTNLDLLAAIVDGEREQRDALWQMAKEILRLTEVLEAQEKILEEVADHAGITAGARPSLAEAPRPAPALRQGAPAGVPPPPVVSAAPTEPLQPTAASEPPVIEEPLAFTAPPQAEVPLAAKPPAAAAPPPPAVVPPVPSAPRPSWLDEMPPLTQVPLPTPASGIVAEPQEEPEVPVPQPPEQPAAESFAPTPASAGAVAPPSTGGDVSEMQRLRAELEAERLLVERLRESRLKLEHRAADAEAELEARRTKRRGSVLSRILKTDEEA